jgi:protein-S-isoprenylcysteine O-methyltransferase Ste14
LLLGPGLVWVVGEWCIGPEERYLAGKFGDEYHRYRARVRRWL